MGKHTLRCPTCHKAVSWEDNVFRPFCSERCRQIDLQGWFNERYRIAQDEGPDPDDTNNLEKSNGDSFPD